MDTFLSGCKRKNADTSGNKTEIEQGSKAPKKRQYSSSYLSLGFTSVSIDGLEKPMCLLCSKVLASDSMRPVKLKRHHETLHSEYVDKPIEFFQRKLDELNNQKQTFKKIFSVTPNALLLASYHVSYRIAKCKKPHTIGETLILPAAIDMVRIMFGESYAKQLRQIPLADNTVGRRINDISEDICDQLVSRLRTSKFAIQVDEATDIAKDAHLIAYVRYVGENNILEDILFCKPIPGRTTSIEIFNIMDSFFEENDITWNNCIGLCTDGAHSMSGHKAGLQALVKKKAPHAIWTHCMLHRAALVSKNMSEELNNIFTKITKIINYIKNSPLRSRLFAKLCVDMEANYTSLLYYCEVRWLSRAKVIQRVFELKEEIATFLEGNHHEEAHLWTNDNFLVKLAYLVEIFGKLSSLNKSMQGSQMHPLVQKDKVKAFIKKLNLWKSNLQKNELDMFSLLKDFWATANIETSKNLFIEHLDGLVLHFSNYFKDLDFSKFLWVQNPFIDNEDDEFELTTIEKEKLIELSCDSLLKQKFQNETLIQFWMNLSGEYEYLYYKAMQVLLPFVTSYLCETGFSALAAMKTKYRARLVVEKELRVALSTLPPRFDKLCANKQQQPSH
jgi:hypothetical protein